MKEITIKLYEFDDLSVDVQRKVIERHRRINVNGCWYDSIYEDAKKIGLKINEFSIYYQRIRGEVITSAKRGEFITSAIDCAINILKEHGEQLETYEMALNFINDRFKIHREKSVDKCRDLRDNIDDFKRSLLEYYFINIRREYGYQLSDKMVIKSIRANGYTFEEDGTIRNV
jgi:hypothetical protein